MANRKATFAKRQRETELKDRARAKDARRLQKRTEAPGTKGPQIAWDEAVHATTTNELLPLNVANERPDEAETPSDQDDAAPAPVTP